MCMRLHAPTLLQTVKVSSTSAPATPVSRPAVTPEKPDNTPSGLAPVAVTPTRSFSKRLKSKLKGRKSREHSHELTPEGDDADAATMPGGDAMLEVLTRVQCYQDSLIMQLEVSGWGS